MKYIQHQKEIDTLKFYLILFITFSDNITVIAKIYSNEEQKGIIADLHFLNFLSYQQMVG